MAWRYAPACAASVIFAGSIEVWKPNKTTCERKAAPARAARTTTAASGRPQRARKRPIAMIPIEARMGMARAKARKRWAGTRRCSTLKAR